MTLLTTQLEAIPFVGSPGETVGSRIASICNALYVLCFVAFSMLVGAVVYTVSFSSSKTLDLVDWPLFVVFWVLVGAVGSMYGAGLRWRDVPDWDGRLQCSDLAGTMGPRLALVGVVGIWRDVLVSYSLPAHVFQSVGTEVLCAAVGLGAWCLAYSARAAALSFFRNPARLPSVCSRTLMFCSLASVGVAGGLSLLTRFSGFGVGAVGSALVSVFGYGVALALRDVQPHDTQAERDEWASLKASSAASGVAA